MMLIVFIAAVCIHGAIACTTTDTTGCSQGNLVYKADGAAEATQCAFDDGTNILLQPIADGCTSFFLIGQTTTDIVLKNADTGLFWSSTHQPSTVGASIKVDAASFDLIQTEFVSISIGGDLACLRAGGSGTITTIPPTPLCLSMYNSWKFIVQVDPCADVTCENGGSCEADGDTATCNCAPEYTGERCETKIGSCDSNPCAANKRCVTTDTGFTCKRCGLKCIKNRVCSEACDLPTVVVVKRHTWRWRGWRNWRNWRNAPQWLKDVCNVFKSHWKKKRCYKYGRKSDTICDCANTEYSFV